MMLSHPALLSVWVGFILSQDSFFPGSSLSPAWQSWGKKAPLSQKLLQKSQDSLCLDQHGSMHLARAVLTTWNVRLLSCTDTKPTCPLVLLEFRNCHQQRPFCLIVLRLFSLLGRRSSFLFFFFLALSRIHLCPGCTAFTSGRPLSLAGQNFISCLSLPLLHT